MLRIKINKLNGTYLSKFMIYIYFLSDVGEMCK